jgi:hypothetical protein
MTFHQHHRQHATNIIAVIIVAIIVAPSVPPPRAPGNNLCRITLGSRLPTTRHHRHHPTTTRHQRHYPVIANTINLPCTPLPSIGPRHHRQRRDRRPSSSLPAVGESVGIRVSRGL